MGKVKLSFEDVREIKRRLSSGEISITIAKDFGITHGQVRKIRAGMQENPPNYARWTYIGITPSQDKY